MGVYGIIVVALITSIIVNFYGEMKIFTTLDQYYDRAALTDYINSLCWGGK